MNDMMLRLMAAFAVAALVLTPVDRACAGTLCTWNGGTNGTWLTVTNWTDDAVPDSASEDALIDGNPEQATVVSYVLTNSAAETIGALTLDAGDSLSVGRVNASGTSSLTITSALSNAGTLTAGGSSMGSSHGNTFLFTVQGGAGGTFNLAGGVVNALSLSNYRRSTSIFSLPASNTNEGTVYVRNITSQGAGYVKFNLTGSGSSVFVNDGTIMVEGTGSSPGNSQPWALVTPGSASATLILGGTGTVTLASCLGNRLDAYAVIAGGTTNTTLINTETHTIRGNGYIGRSGNNGTAGNNVTVYSFASIQNEGLIQASRSASNQVLFMAANGGRLINTPSGRMVVAGSTATVMRVGSDTALTTFTNNGLLEVRSQSLLVFATSTVARLNGEIRGGGVISVATNLTFATATLAPGDSASADGTGPSTVGCLSVTGNVVLASTTTMAWQLGKADTAGIDYDTVNVSGNLTLDGTLVIERLSGCTGGRYRLFTCVPGGITDYGIALDSPLASLDINPDAGTVDLLLAKPGTIITVR